MGDLTDDDLDRVLDALRAVGDNLPVEQLMASLAHYLAEVSLGASDLDPTLAKELVRLCTGDLDDLIDDFSLQLRDAMN